MSTAIRIDTQIRETEKEEYRIIGSRKGKSHWDSYEPDRIVKVNYTVKNNDLVIINPDETYLIPSIITAKEGDTAVTEDGKTLRYKNNRWNVWSTSISGSTDWGASEW